MVCSSAYKQYTFRTHRPYLTFWADPYHALRSSTTSPCRSQQGNSLAMDIAQTPAPVSCLSLRAFVAGFLHTRTSFHVIIFGMEMFRQAVTLVEVQDPQMQILTGSPRPGFIFESGDRIECCRLHRHTPCINCGHNDSYNPRLGTTSRTVERSGTTQSSAQFVP